MKILVCCSSVSHHKDLLHLRIMKMHQDGSQEVDFQRGGFHL